MKYSHLIDHLDDSRITAAIADAESKTTGQIRVMVSKRSHPNALLAAEKHFKVLKLDKTPERNAILIFVAPKSQTFAIYGDAAAHARYGAEFFNTLRDEMIVHLKDSRYTDAIVHAIGKAGGLMAVHFPKAEPPNSK